MKPVLRGIHYGSYMFGVNDVVNVMSEDLCDLCELTRIDLNVYGKPPSSTVEKIERTPNGHIVTLSGEKIKSDIKEYSPDFLIFNSGGLLLSKEVKDYAKKHNVVCVGISLSDPDVFPFNGNVYAHMFDIFYTNSVYSLTNQYDHSRVNVKHIPFAASEKRHFYMPDVEKEFDIVVVGGRRPDREKAIELLRKKFRVGLFGGGWKNGEGRVHGEELVHAINRGKIYLSFARTSAGYQNIKVGMFESAACNTFIVTSFLPELSHYFQYGTEIACYNENKMLPKLMAHYLHNAHILEWQRANCYQRFLKEHTWRHRWKNIIQDIERLKNE